LDVWYIESSNANGIGMDAETIEAEIVFLIRFNGQWPKYQTEIHFHSSESWHRELAASVLGHYGVAC